MKMQMSERLSRVDARLPKYWDMLRKINPDTRERLRSRSITMDREEHEAFWSKCRAELDRRAIFAGWFLVHVVTPPEIFHRPGSTRQVDEAWESVTRLVTVDEGEQANWKVLIGLRIRSLGNTSLIRTTARMDFLQKVTPNIAPHHLERRLERTGAVIPCYNYANASALQVSTKGLPGNDGVEYILVTPKYHRPLPFQPLEPKQLYPNEIQRTFKSVKERMRYAMEQVNKQGNRNGIYTSVSILTSFDTGKTTGKINLTNQYEVVDGNVWWYVHVHYRGKHL